MRKVAKKTVKKERVDSIEKLAQLVAEGFADITEEFQKRFDQVDVRFVALEAEVRNGFIVSERHMDRIETRIAALEFAVFGVDSAKGQHNSTTWFSRIEDLEKAVFKNKAK